MARLMSRRVQRRLGLAADLALGVTALLAGLVLLVAGILPIWW